MKNLETVFVYLENEGVDVWRPTQAEQLPDGSYQLLPTPDYDAEDEQWQFVPGTIVRCERRQLSDGEQLVAVRTATATDARKRTA